VISQRRVSSPGLRCQTRAPLTSHDPPIPGYCRQPSSQRFEYTITPKIGSIISDVIVAEAVTGELFGVEPERQLTLNLAAVAQAAWEAKAESCEPQSAEGGGSDPGSDAGEGDEERDYRRNYSPAQRVYLDQLEQGDYNAYAGGLLFAPLLARYDFLSPLRQRIALPTCEGYRLEELSLTLFYLDVFGFRSMEDFKRAYRGEFGVLVGRAQSPSLFTLRRFLHKVRELGQGEALIDAFGVGYLRSGLAAWGVMYIDGHFMPYYQLGQIC
jgi:hypothetical protein